ncbi:MAG: hypothetical protein J6A33_07515 [Alphaproteobacteria bacterium]|nr:hypothetical protein [Alphaproteobacteria bacterium]
MCNCHNEKNKCSCGCGCDETCTCGCQEGKECTCGCNCNCDCGCHGISDKEMAFELCKTLIEGRTYTAEKVAETYKILFDAIKSCN